MWQALSLRCHLSSVECMQPLHDLTALTALTHLALPCVGRAPGETSRWTSLALEQLYGSLLEGLPGEVSLQGLLLPVASCATLLLIWLEPPCLQVCSPWTCRTSLPGALSCRRRPRSSPPCHVRPGFPAATVHLTSMVSACISGTVPPAVTWRAVVCLGQRLPEWVRLERLMLRGFSHEVARLSTLRTLLVVLELRDSVRGVMRHVAHLRAPSPKQAPPCEPAPAAPPLSDPVNHRRVSLRPSAPDMAEVGHLQNRTLTLTSAWVRDQRAWRTWSCGGRGRARPRRCSWRRSTPRT